MKAWQKYAAEFYGTFVLVGIGAGAIIGSAFLGGNLIRGIAFNDASALADGFSFESKIVTVALAFGLALIVALYTVGRISGGHFNPAVSLGAFLDKRISLNDMLAYWVAQIAGALLAMVAFWWVLGDRSDVAVSATVPNRAAVDEFGGFIAEAVFTAVFVFAILVLAKSRAHTKFLGMGFSYAAIHFIGIAFTGASVNPARSFAPALVGDTWDGFWLYIVGPLVGAIVGFVLYKVIHQGDTDFSDDVKHVADSV